MRMIAELCRGLRAASAELGLPQDEHELGVWVSGLAYGLVVYVGLLILVSWVTAKALGLPL